MSDSDRASILSGFAATVGNLIKNSQQLVRQKIALAQSQLEQDVGKIRDAALALALGYFITACGGVLLCMAMVHLLHWCTNCTQERFPLWACYGLVGAMVACIGLVVALAARKKMNEVKPLARLTPHGEKGAAKKPEILLQEFEQTRMAVVQGLGELECQLRGTVGTARTALEETTQRVKSAAQEVIQSVAGGLDWGKQIDQHPWAAVGGSVAAGFLIGAITRHRLARTGTSETAQLETNRTEARPSTPTKEQTPDQPGLLTGLHKQLEREMAEVLQVALSAIMDVVRDFARESLPQLLSQLGQVLTKERNKNNDQARLAEETGPNDQQSA